MAHRIQRLPIALPWTFKQADRRERQSDHVLNTPETRQSQAAGSSDAGSQASQQVLPGHDSQIMIAGLAAEVRPVPQQLAAKEESAGDDEHLHQSGATQKICSELVSEALLNLDSTQEVLSSTPLLDLGLTFRLNSRPSATKVIYLDFNGHTTSGTSWNNSTMGSSFYSPAYDTNGDPASFSDSELISIQQIWQRVANDFSAFDVNVTLQEPPADWLARAGSGDESWGVRAVISSYGPSSSTAAGIAFVGSFNSSTDTPVFIYNKTLIGVSETISHEVGHALGLSHDGTASTTYYTGHGGTGETSWAPIMGGSYNRNVTTWDDGTYTGSNNTGSTANYGKGDDDLAIIVGGNGFSYRPDLVGNSALAAASLSIVGETVGQFGTIETRYDVDYYSFEILDFGNLDLSFSPYWYRAYVDEDGVWGGSHTSYLANTSDVRSTTPYPDNAASLDLEVQLYDRYSNLLYTSNDPGLATSISLQGLSKGTYFLKLDGVGFGDPTASTPTGYTDYASIGDYWISGTITSAAGVSTPPVITLSLSPSLVKEDGSANLLYTFTRSQASAQSLSVNFTVSGTATNGSDYTGLKAGSSQSVTFAANAATATVVIDPTADSIVEPDETVSLLLAPGTGYSIGTTNAVTGTISNDDSVAAPLVFTTQADILTGTSGTDSFTLNRLSDAFWSVTPDRITNLQAGVDTIDSPFTRSSAINPRQLGMVKTLDVAGIGGLLTRKTFAKNGASTFTFGDGGNLRTFLALNDGRAGFNASSDSVIEITGYAGSLSTLAIF
jgi:hypothetical protein